MIKHTFISWCHMAGKDGCNGDRVSSEHLLCIVMFLILTCVASFFFFLFHGINLTASESLGLWGTSKEIFQFWELKPLNSIF